MAFTSASTAFAAPTAGFRTLPGHIPAAAASARAVSALDAAQTVTLALALPLHHQAELTDLLHGLSDPSDPRCGQFLTPEQFEARYSPTPAEYGQVIAYAKARGLSVTATHANRTLLDVSAPAAQVEKVFGLHLLVYQVKSDGRTFYAPDAEPQVPSSLASLITGVVGLSSASRRQPHLVSQAAPEITPALDPYAAPFQTGSGPGGALAPSDIKAAYNLSVVSQTGSGQTLGLFELDGYMASDIAAYEAGFGLPNVPLQNILIDGFNGVPADPNGSAEVTLDIELQAALAPNASKILVYEAPNTDQGVVDAYSKIASDNLAKEISTSWGEAEMEAPASVRSSENSAFQQMAAQGQSIFAASGDHGAYDTGNGNDGLTVDDPASQPYMVGVGGTSLSTNGGGGSYKSETAWNNNIGGGGGGVSTVWTMPAYQSGFAGSAASKGSAGQRNVPDVSLDADPYTGYDVYYNGGWNIYGGTSCAAPLWAAFTALVNQKRAAAGLGLLGFANPPLYSLAASRAYANDFHDIADGSTNFYYPAVAGYDDVTGLGTFNGVSLLTDLSGGNAVPPAGQVRFAPRVGWASRMVGGQFQGSTDSNTWTALATVTQAPPSGQYSALPTSMDPASFRFLRYLAPNGSYGNIAEIEFDSSGVKLAGTPFGTAGSWSNNGNDFTKAFDGSTATFFDAPEPGNGDFVGIDRGGSGGPNQVRFAPRAGRESRMVGGLFQGSQDNSAWTTLATVAQVPLAGQYSALPTSMDPASFRFLRYLAPNGSYGNIAEIEFDSNGVKLAGTPFGTPGSWSNNGSDFTKAFDGSTATFFDAPEPGNGDFVGIDRGAGYTKLTGTPFGTPGSWSNNGNDFTKAFDGSTATFFDAPEPGSGDFVGIDLGPGNTAPPTRIGYCPRAGLENRMVGGVFQGSSDNMTWTALYTVTSAPAAGTLTETTLTGSVPYRYLRYLAPNGCYGNIAELEFDTSP